jgi:hypothetical protein
MTTLTIPQIRKEASAWLTNLAGAKPRDSYWRIPIDDSPRQSISVGFRVTTKAASITIDRFRGATLPREDVEARWIKGVIEPHAMEWLYWRNSRTESNTMPSAGTFTGTKVKPESALEVLHLWVPMEIHWQREIRDLFAAAGDPTTPFFASKIDHRPTAPELSSI